MKSAFKLTISLTFFAGLSLTPTPAFACGGEPRPFTSDGCSHKYQSDQNGILGMGATGVSYLKCCFVHDIAYYEGGPEAKRQVADENFKSCLIGAVNDGCKANPLKCPGGKNTKGDYKHAVRTATSMHAAVRVFGDKNCGADNDWEWGYGWSQSKCECRGKPDMAKLKKSLESHPFGNPKSIQTDADAARWIQQNLDTADTRLKARPKADLRNLKAEINRVLQGSGDKNTKPVQ